MSESFEIFKFLEVYRRYPCLWKKNCQDYKNRAKRELAEHFILPCSGLKTSRELRKKIHNIRCTYNQERNKIKKSIKTDSHDVYKPKLVWYDFADSFLRENEENEDESCLETINNKGCSSYLHSNAQSLANPTTLASRQPEERRTNSSRKEIKSNKGGSSYLLSQVESSFNPITLASRQPEEETTNSSREVRKNKYESTDLSSRNKNELDFSAVITLKEAAERVANLNAWNEFIYFGNLVASQLRSLPLEEAIKVGAEIQAIITAARLRCIKKSTTTDTTSNDQQNNIVSGGLPEIKIPLDENTGDSTSSDQQNSSESEALLESEASPESMISVDGNSNTFITVDKSHLPTLISFFNNWAPKKE